MEVSVPIHKVNTQNIYFADKRKNIIVDGDFVKILYSTESFEMNGLYILVELDALVSSQQWILQSTSQLMQKNSIIFSPVSIKNEMMVRRLCQIEQDIVKRYIASYCPSKTATYLLKTQLMGSSIKYHSENMIIRKYSDDSLTKQCVLPSVSLQGLKNHSTALHIRSGIADSLNPTRCAYGIENCILKISGIWETATNVGITMKFILLH
jgi:hypothetical protein